MNRKKLHSAVPLVQMRWENRAYPCYPYTKEELYEAAARIRDHMKDCSCAMCDNPRHNVWETNRGKLTMQERRNLDKFEEWNNLKLLHS